MINDKVLVSDSGVTGQLTIKLTAADGTVKDNREVKNLVVGSGKDYIARLMRQAATGVVYASPMSHMAVGTTQTAAVTGDVGLGAEVGRVALTLSSGANTGAGPTATYSASFGPGVGTGALKEAGILNAASGGNMLARTTFNVVNKEAGDSLTITWSITVN
jgi:hypothetical protein